MSDQYRFRWLRHRPLRWIYAIAMIPVIAIVGACWGILTHLRDHFEAAR